MLSEEERKAKENALSGLTGGSFSEIVTLLLVVPCAILLYRFLYVAVLKKLPQFFSVLASVVFAICPLVFTMSVYTEYTPLFCLACVAIVAVGSRLVSRSVNGEEQMELMNGPIKPFLSNYRAAMMLATCTAILAVDFNLFFPVRFAKCEEYGISLMDVGVGGFIFSSALTSAKPRPLPNLSASTASTASKSPKPAIESKKSTSGVVAWSMRLLQSLKMVVPLLILGLGRFTVIKAFGYQEHVTEYGMHWNFFMTLAGITLLVTALSVPLEYSGLCGIAILVVYHYVLEAMGVADWIIRAPRVDFFSQNREGILSCFGYLALYLFGRQVGSYLMQVRTRKEWWRATAYLASGGLLLWAGASSMGYFLDMFPSRRMVNMPYALYTLACNFIIISAFIVVDLVQNSQPNALMDAVATRRNSQLVIFTLANLMTGAMNVFIGTFNRPVSAAAALMLLYMTLVSIVSLYWFPVYTKIASLCKKQPKSE